MNSSRGKLTQWSFCTQLEWVQDYPLLLPGIRRLNLCWIVMILPLMNILVGKLTFYEFVCTFYILFCME